MDGVSGDADDFGLGWGYSKTISKFDDDDGCGKAQYQFSVAGYETNFITIFHRKILLSNYS